MTYTKDTIEFLPKPTHPNFKDVTGTVYGRLTVIGFAGREKLRTSWFCECICGNIKKAVASDLQSGKTKSCGCLFNESTTRFQVTHGMRNTPEYSSYCKAKERCNNPNDKRYKDYGGRGIEFRFISFEQFITEVGKKPTAQHSIDRIDVNGHYEIGNVRWATHLEQAHNTRTNRPLTCNGRTQLLIDWARELGVHSATILERLKRGWSIEDALVPVRRITFQNQTLSRAEWERQLGFTKGAIFNRLKMGWSMEKILTTPLRPCKPRRSSDTTESKSDQMP